MMLPARPRRSVGLLLVVLPFALAACGALRQNVRNQFTSYRGAWHCPDKACRQPKMVRSNQGHREGDVKVSHVKLNKRAAMVFYPGTPAETFTAKISCGGQTLEVPSERVLAPGQHKISGQADAWVVLVDASDYVFSDCKSYRVLSHSTWENGKREYDEPGGIDIK